MRGGAERATAKKGKDVRMMGAGTDTEELLPLHRPCLYRRVCSSKAAPGSLLLPLAGGERVQRAVVVAAAAAVAFDLALYRRASAPLYSSCSASSGHRLPFFFSIDHVKQLMQ